jgi:hypothetical protein
VAAQPSLQTNSTVQLSRWVLLINLCWCCACVCLRQEIIPTLTAVQYPVSTTVRVRKRRAQGPAEFCLAELGPQYVIWGRHKRQRSEHPKRMAKSPAQLSSSLQRMLASSPQLASAQQGSTAAGAKSAPQQQLQRAAPQQQERPQSRSNGSEQRKHQQQRHTPLPIPPRPPSPRLDDFAQPVPAMPLQQAAQAVSASSPGRAGSPAAPLAGQAAVAQHQSQPPALKQQQQQPVFARAAAQVTSKQPSAAAVSHQEPKQQAQPSPAAAPTLPEHGEHKQQQQAIRPDQKQQKPAAKGQKQQQKTAPHEAPKQLQQAAPIEQKQQQEATPQDQKQQQNGAPAPQQPAKPAAQDPKQQKAAAPEQQQQNGAAPSEPAALEQNRQKPAPQAQQQQERAAATEQPAKATAHEQKQQAAPQEQKQQQKGVGLSEKSAKFSAQAQQQQQKGGAASDQPAKPAAQAQQQQNDTSASRQPSQPAAQQEEAAKQPAQVVGQETPAQRHETKAEARSHQEQEQPQQSEASTADVSDSIATRLRRKKGAEQPETSSAQQGKQQKQNKGKQKQQHKADASQDSGPPAKKTRTANEGAPALAAAGKEPAAAAAGKAPPAKAPAAKVAAVTPAAKTQAQTQAAAAPAKTAAPANKLEVPPAKPAAASKPGAAAKASAAGKAAATATKPGPAEAAAPAPAAAAAADKVGPSAPAGGTAAAAQDLKVESPPSETSHQQPIATPMPQHLQLQQPLQPVVPQLPQEQTAVSRDRSQCSMQQPAESPAAVASAGAAGGLRADGSVGAAAGSLREFAGTGAPGLAAAGGQAQKHLLELEASAMTPAALALGSLTVPTVSFRPVVPDKPFNSQEEAWHYLESMMNEARRKKHTGDSRCKQMGGWDVMSLSYYAYSALEFLRYWDACHKASKQLADAGKPSENLKKRMQYLTSTGLLKQVSQLCTTALQNAGNCKGQDVQKQALRMLLERLCAICQLRHLHSQREMLSQHANLLKGAVMAPGAGGSGSSKAGQQQVQHAGAGRPPARAVVTAATAAAGGSSPRGKQAFNKRSPDDSNTSNQDRVQLPGLSNSEQHSPGLVHGSSPGAGGSGAAGGNGAAAGSGVGESQEHALRIAEGTCAEHLSELLKITDGMHQTVMRMQQFLESPEVLADADARCAALHISTLGLDAGMFSVPRVVAHAEAALVGIVRSGRRGMLRTAS